MKPKRLTSLCRLAKNEFRAASARNPTHRSLRGHPLRGLGDVVRARPIAFALTLLVINIVLGLALTCPTEARHSVAARLPAFLAIFDPEWSTSDVLTILGYLWSVQATLAALVYPIVISFIALLLQQRSGTGRRIDVYLDATGALPASISAMALLGAIGFQYCTLIYVVHPNPSNANEMLAWTVVDFVWFGLNLVLTVNFTVKSIGFLRPEEQRRAVQRHLAINVWPREVQMRIGNALLLQPWLATYLSGGREATGTSIIAFNQSARGAGQKIHSEMGAGKWLSDVNLRRLRWALRLIRYRHDRHLKKIAALPHSLAASQDYIRPLVSPLSLNVRYTGNIPLLKAAANWPVGGIAAFLVKHSFVFTRNQPSVLSTKQYVIDAVTEACDAIATGRPTRLGDAYQDLVAIHATILAIGELELSSGQFFNWSSLPGIRGFGQAVDEDFGSVYIDLFDAAVDRIGTDSQPFGRCAQLARDLLLGTQELKSLAARMSIVRLPSVLMHSLSRWWIQAIESTGAFTHTACQSQNLTGTQGAVYQEVLRGFVGAWESVTRLGEVYFLKDAPQNWAEFSRLGQYYVTHLTQTVLMFISAVYRGDEAAAEWMGSVIKGWWSTIERQVNRQIETDVFVDWVTVSAFSRSWEDVSNAYGHEADPAGVFGAALRNYWQDCRCLLFYRLTATAKACTSPSSFAARTASNIFHGLHNTGGGVGHEAAIPLADSFSSALNQLLRQSVSMPANWESYPSRLNDLLLAMRHEMTMPLVQGRVSVTSDALGLTGFRESQALYLVLIRPPQTLSLSERVTSCVERMIDDNLASCDEIIRLTGELEQYVVGNLPTPMGRLVSDIWGGTPDPLARGRSLGGTRSMLRHVLDYAKQHNARVLAASAVSEQRLSALGRTLSDQLRSEPVSHGALALFKHIDASIEVLPEREILVNDQVSKAEFTDPSLIEPAYSKPDLLIGVLREGIGGAALDVLLNNPTVVSVDGSDIGKYTREVSKSAAALMDAGREPMVIVHSASVPNWMTMARLADDPQSAGFPPDTVIEIKTGERIEGYYFHLNNVPIYRVMELPPETSVIIAKQNFESIWLGRYENGAVVRAHWQADINNPTVGALTLRFSIKPLPLIGTATRLLH